MRIDIPQQERGLDMAKEFTAEEIVTTLREWGEVDGSFDASAWLSQTVELMNRWIERGDGIAVYENQDLGHPELGDKKFVSFGSAAAQLEPSEAPKQLPDIGGQINWRYALIGTYKGEPLSL